MTREAAAHGAAPGSSTALPVLRTARLAIRPLTDADGAACRAVLPRRTTPRSGAGSPGPSPPPLHLPICSSRPTASAQSCSGDGRTGRAGRARSRARPVRAARRRFCGRSVDRRARPVLGALARASRPRLRHGSGHSLCKRCLRHSLRSARRTDRARQRRLAGGHATPWHADAHEPALRAHLAAGRRHFSTLLLLSPREPAGSSARRACRRRCRPPCRRARRRSRRAGRCGRWAPPGGRRRRRRGTTAGPSAGRSAASPP